MQHNCSHFPMVRGQCSLVSKLKVPRKKSPTSSAGVAWAFCSSTSPHTAALILPSQSLDLGLAERYIAIVASALNKGPNIVAANGSLGARSILKNRPQVPRTSPLTFLKSESEVRFARNLLRYRDLQHCQKEEENICRREIMASNYRDKPPLPKIC
jgi:hypothetical protein